MRKFNVLLMDRTIRGTQEVLTTNEFNDLLGSADEVVYEIEVSEAGGTTPAVSLRHLHCNSNEDLGFKGLTNLINQQSLATLPYRDVVMQAGPLGGLGKAGVKLDGTTPTARVRLWACGRTV
jgi:hypothetical protein